MDISLWGLDINHQDRLVFGGCDLVELARTYGTPLHVVDAGRLRRNYQTFLRAFQNSYPRVNVFYSYKTNCVSGVLALLHEEGCGAEVTSPYELWLASQLGVAPAAVVYNGVNKSVDDLQRAIQTGVRLINIDSVAESQKLKQAAERVQKKVNVGIRVDPGLGWKAHFGIQPWTDQMADVINDLHSSEWLRLCCLHVHIGSGIRETNLYQQTIKKITWWVRELQRTLPVEIEALDLGGGFGVPTVKTLTRREATLYKVFNRPPREPAVEECPSAEHFGEALTDTLKDCCARYGLSEPQLFLEPGRIITGNAQILLVTVRDVKSRNNGARFALTDGGMQNVAFPLSYEYHHCFLASRASARLKERYFVTGPLCSPEDLLYRNCKLPQLQRGDVLAIMDAGAYFISFSNSFSYPRPAVVLASEGTHRIIRARESFEHMNAVDRI